MQIRVRRPDGRIEIVEPIRYTVRQRGGIWYAFREDGSLLARGCVSEQHLRRICDASTRHVRWESAA